MKDSVNTKCYYTINFFHVVLTYCSLFNIFFVPTATPQPTINLTKSALQNLSISWSVTSPQDVTSYIVFWLKGSAVIGKSDVLNDIMFTIENLLSNTAYHVVVQANGPLGSVNSTSKVFYTTPNKVQGKFTKHH